MKKCGSIVAALAVIAFTAGCTNTDGGVLYCGPDDQSRRQGAMHIDTERRLVYGVDTSYDFHPFVDGHFAGFTFPFPLLLISDSVDPSEMQSDTAVDGTAFRISAIEGSFGDLWLITAKPIDAGSELEGQGRSTVLYSIEDGVLSISLSVFVDQEFFPGNYVPCGNRTLRYDDFRSFSAE